jgi:hypothetical protein
MQQRFYCLSLRMLSRIGHAVVALPQIMDAQAQFLDSNARRSRFVLRFALTCLQRQVENGNRHVLPYSVRNLGEVPRSRYYRAHSSTPRWDRSGMRLAQPRLLLGRHR